MDPREARGSACQSAKNARMRKREMQNTRKCETCEIRTVWDREMHAICEMRENAKCARCELWNHKMCEMCEVHEKREMLITRKRVKCEICEIHVMREMQNMQKCDNCENLRAAVGPV
jgi:hypothetical protein